MPPDSRAWEPGLLEAEAAPMPLRAGHGSPACLARSEGGSHAAGGPGMGARPAWPEAEAAPTPPDSRAWEPGLLGQKQRRLPCRWRAGHGSPACMARSGGPGMGAQPALR